MTEPKEQKDKTAQREIFHNPNLTDFYRQIWGRYNENTLRKDNIPVDKVMVGLGISALLNSCDSSEHPKAHTQKETPEQLEAKLARMKKQTEEIKGLNDSLETYANVASGVASGETKAEVLMPQKTNDTNYDLTYLIIAGGVLIAGLIATYAKQVYLGMQFSAREKEKRKQREYDKIDPKDMSPAGKKLREDLNARLNTIKDNDNQVQEELK